MIRIGLPLRILGWQRAGGEGRRVKPHLQRRHQKEILDHVKDQVERLRLSGPVGVALLVGIEPPPSWPKHRRLAACRGEIEPTNVPDIDNLLKQVCDALNGYLWDDDRRIVLSFARKQYHDFDHSILLVGEPSEFTLSAANQPIHLESA